MIPKFGAGRYIGWRGITSSPHLQTEFFSMQNKPEFVTCALFEGIGIFYDFFHGKAYFFDKPNGIRVARINECNQNVHAAVVKQFVYQPFQGFLSVSLSPKDRK